MRSKLILLGLGMAFAGVVRADFNPILLTPTSFNADVVVEKTAQPSVGCATTVSMDGGTNNTGATWYEIGYNTNVDALTTGIPVHGAEFTTVDGNHTFLMAPSYTTNDVFFISSQVSNATLTVTSPSAFTGLSFLAAAGGGATTNRYTIHYADATTQTGTVVALDWFNNTAAYTANGRVDASSGAYNAVNTGNPRLYTADVALANTASAVTSIDLVFGGGARSAIFALAGTLDGVTYTSVPVTGYNKDAIVEAGAPYPGPLTNFTTITMDGGTNNNLRTWFELGYYPAFPAAGLPPAGSTISSLAQPDHHYMMPASYAANNCIFVDSNHPIANLTIAAPATYSALSFLSATANGNVTNQCVMQYADGTMETNTFVSRDWFFNTPYAFTANGRVNVDNSTFADMNSTEPRLYEAQFALGNVGSAVTNVVLKYLGAVNPATARMVVFAVSATAGAVPPIIGIQPQSINAYQGSNFVLSATITGGTAPISYQWQVGTNGVFVNLANGGAISGANTPVLTFTGAVVTNSADYRLVASNVAGAVNSAVVTVGVFNPLPDVTSPGDFITYFSGSTPANEVVQNAIDNNSGTKYLNYGTDGDLVIPFSGPVGFDVTPNVGSTVVSAIRFYTANDTEARDPADFTLEGSNDGGTTWEPIASGPLALPPGRNTAAATPNPFTQNLQEVNFANSTPYLSYRVTFAHTKSDSTVNSLQIGEVELLGTFNGPPTILVDLPSQISAYAGRPAYFSVTAVGAAPLHYQWQSNGVDLVDGGRVSGANSNILSIANVQLGETGSYQVFVSNSVAGPVASSVGTLQVEARPTFNGNGLGWGLNGGAVVNGDVLDITAGLGGTARSAFFNYPLYIGAFTASFTYVDIGGGGADGFAFVVQNSPQGPAALGPGGGELGYGDIAPSAAIEFNIYAPNTNGVAFRTNGLTGIPYGSTAPVDVSSGDNIDMTIHYASGQVQLALTNTGSGVFFTTNVNIGDLSAIVGGNTAYVGFTGADGGIASYQQISNFKFFSYPTLTSAATDTNTVVLTWPASIGGFVLQSTPDLSVPDWQDVAAPVSLVGDQNRVVVPASGSGSFFRLTLP